MEIKAGGKKYLNMEEKWIWAIAVIVLIFVVGAFFQKSYDIFAILPTGQYSTNSDCTFITNANFGTNGEQIDDYGGSQWIAVDWSKDGAKEGYGYYGSTSGTSADICLGKEIITYTQAGFKVVKYSASSSYNEVGICSGGIVKRFRDNDPDVTSAILSCPTTCTENWDCSVWSVCMSNQQTRTCTDLNSCGTTSLKPAITQSCIPSCTCKVDANCDNTIDRTELGYAIDYWVTG